MQVKTLNNEKVVMWLEGATQEFRKLSNDFQWIQLRFWRQEPQKKVCGKDAELFIFVILKS